MNDTTTAKRGYCADIEEATIANNHFRRVLYTGEHLQLVLMSLASLPLLAVDVAVSIRGILAGLAGRRIGWTTEHRG